MTDSMIRGGIGPSTDAILLPLLSNVGTSTYAMPSQNNGVSALHVARDTQDVLGIVVNWGTITSPGTVEFRYETDASGKPSGTLYDANATKTVTPTAGIQEVTFDTPPTTGRTAGDYYHVVLITATNGTAHTLSSHIGEASIPRALLTATDGSTRTNFAVVNPSTPICALRLEDNSLTTEGMMPFMGVATLAIYGADRCGGALFDVPNPIDVVGFEFSHMLAVSSFPAYVFSIIDSSNNVISGTQVTIPADKIYSTGRRWEIPFNGVVTIPAGVCRAVLYAAAGAGDSSNYCGTRYATALDASLCPTFGRHTLSTNWSSTKTFTDTNGSIVSCQFKLYQQETVSGGSGSNPGTTFSQGEQKL